MEERLKRLKNAMNNHTFRQVEFTDIHRQKINQQIEQLQEEDVSKVLLSLLNQAKTGSELIQLLHIRGINGILNNEGTVFTILHEQEQQGVLESYWSENNEKYYKLTKKGQKILQKTMLPKTSGELSVKQLFHEVMPNEN